MKTARIEDLGVRYSRSFAFLGLPQTWSAWVDHLRERLLADSALPEVDLERVLDELVAVRCVEYAALLREAVRIRLVVQMTGRDVIYPVAWRRRLAYELEAALADGQAIPVVLLDVARVAPSCGPKLSAMAHSSSRLASGEGGWATLGAALIGEGRDRLAARLARGLRTRGWCRAAVMIERALSAPRVWTSELRDLLRFAVEAPLPRESRVRAAQELPC